MHKKTVLVLNKNWRPINVISVVSAIKLMYSGLAEGVCNKNLIPYKWKEWIQLSPSFNFIKTVNLNIKIPTVIILCKNVSIPQIIPKPTANNIYIRDEFVCQYTGKKLTSKERSIDHVIPKSRGGKTTWKNCVLCHKDINLLKGNKTLQESGLKLIRPPKIPHATFIFNYIKTYYNIKEWETFI